MIPVLKSLKYHLDLVVCEAWEIAQVDESEREKEKRNVPVYDAFVKRISEIENAIETLSEKLWL